MLKLIAFFALSQAAFAQYHSFEDLVGPYDQIPVRDRSKIESIFITSESLSDRSVPDKVSTFIKMKGSSFDILMKYLGRYKREDITPELIEKSISGLVQKKKLRQIERDVVDVLFSFMSYLATSEESGLELLWEGGVSRKFKNEHKLIRYIQLMKNGLCSGALTFRRCIVAMVPYLQNQDMSVLRSWGRPGSNLVSELEGFLPSSEVRELHLNKRDLEFLKSLPWDDVEKINNRIFPFNSNWFFKEIERASPGFVEQLASLTASKFRSILFYHEVYQKEYDKLENLSDNLHGRHNTSFSKTLSSRISSKLMPSGVESFINELFGSWMGALSQVGSIRERVQRAITSGDHTDIFRLLSAITFIASNDGGSLSEKESAYLSSILLETADVLRAHYGMGHEIKSKDFYAYAQELGKAMTILCGRVPEEHSSRKKLLKTILEFSKWEVAHYIRTGEAIGFPPGDDLKIYGISEKKRVELYRSVVTQNNSDALGVVQWLKSFEPPPGKPIDPYTLYIYDQGIEVLKDLFDHDIDDVMVEVYQSLTRVLGQAFRQAAKQGFAKRGLLSRFRKSKRLNWDLKNATSQLIDKTDELPGEAGKELINIIKMIKMMACFRFEEE